MCTNQKWIRWDVMSKQASLQGLLSKIEDVRLKNIMKFRHNWNEVVVRQFYATLEVNHEKETIKWMTWRGKYKASYGEFVDACQLDHHTTKEGTQMDKLLKLKKREAAQLYESSDFKYGKVKNLAMGPSLLNSLLRCTMLPKVDDTGAVRPKYYVAIKSILDGTRVNQVKFLVKEKMVFKHEVKGSLGLQPQFMALVESKAYLQCIEEVEHKSFRPHFNNQDFLTRGMPPSQAPSTEGGESLA